MSQKFPQDEFANAKVAGGRHRRVRTGRHRVAEFFKLFLFSAILAGAVLGGMKLLDSSNLFGGQPTAPATIAVLDGSKQGLSSQVVTELVDKGFEVASSADLIDAENPNKIQVTTVVYASHQVYLERAQEVATALNAGKAVIDSEAGSPITVLIGTDQR
jgi:hypothetical protein